MLRKVDVLGKYIGFYTRRGLLYHLRADVPFIFTGPKKLVLPKRAYFRHECCTIHLDTEDMYWSAYKWHSQTLIETPCMPRAMMLNAKQFMAMETPLRDYSEEYESESRF